MVNLSRARAGTAPALFSLLAVIVLSGAIASSPASAKGTVRVQEPNGTVEIYTDVTLRSIKHNALYVTSSDGKGLLVIDQGACSYVGSILRCLLQDVTLDQSGTKRNLHMEQGTIYANLTDGPLTLPLSSEVVPPKGVVMALRSPYGTYISLKGTIDEVTQ